MRIAGALLALFMALAVHALPVTDNDASCDISALPAATLLLPYFDGGRGSLLGRSRRTPGITPVGLRPGQWPIANVVEFVRFDEDENPYTFSPDAEDGSDPLIGPAENRNPIRTAPFDTIAPGGIPSPPLD